MSIDASIYGQQQQPRINTPFENLQTVLQLRAQQENMRGLREQREAIAEQRRQQTEKLKQDQADRTAVGTAIQQGGGVRAQTLDWARTNAPHTVPTLTEFFDKSDEKASTIKAAKLKIANDEADFLGDVADGILRHGATPDALQTGFAYAVEQFPDYQETAQKLAAQLKDAGPEQIKAFLEHVRDQAPSRRVKPTPNTPQVVAPGSTLVDDQGKTLFSAPAKEEHSPALKEYNDAVSQGYTGTFTQYQNEDANRKRPTINVTAGGEGLDPDGQELLATQYRILGSSAIPTRISGADRARIINQAAAQMKVLGQSPATAIQRQFALKSDAASLTKITNMMSTAEAFENKAALQADLVRDLSEKVNRTNFPVLNRALLAGKRELAGDTDTQLLFNALTTFTSEYAKIIEGSTGSAAGSSDAALSKGTLLQTIDLMQKEMRYTNQGYRATIDHITGRMGGTPATAAPVSPPAPGGISYQDYLNSRKKKPGGG